MAGYPPISAAVLAGWSPEDDNPLAEYTGGGPKALIPIAGKPMIAYVIAALSCSRYVQHLAIVGLDEPLAIESSVPIDYLPTTGGIVDNLEAAVRYIFDRWPETEAMLCSSADIPLITPKVVDAFVESCLESDHDFYYSIVERSVIERRFPNARRTFARLREGAFAGGDLSLLCPSAMQADLNLVRALAGERKHVLKQARMFGVRPLTRFLLGRLSLSGAEARVSEVLGIRGRAIICPYAEIGMDVDKPFQLEIVRSELESRMVW